ncbi:MAG TPA: YoaK family protein [Bryobacteraceae bacterium]|nr:YoaK family protein [Bryobacteraceae bacterium]
MAPRPKKLGAHGTAWIAIGMAWCAGFVDAACYLQLQRVYTSHMTGNTASLASRFLQGDWHEAARYGWAILCFLFGLLLGACLTHAERRNGIRSAFAAVLFLESVLLAAFIWFGRSTAAPVALLIFLPCAAMGMQTVTVTRVGSLRVYTTYLTGTLSKFAEAVAQYAFWLWDRTRGRFRTRIGKVLCVTLRYEPAQHAVLTAGLWFAFFAGAVLGARGDIQWGSIALVVPVGLLAITIVIDLRFPIALGEVTEDELRRKRRFSRRRRSVRHSPPPGVQRAH